MLFSKRSEAMMRRPELKDRDLIRLLTHSLRECMRELDELTPVSPVLAREVFRRAIVERARQVIDQAIRRGHIP